MANPHARDKCVTRLQHCRGGAGDGPPASSKIRKVPTQPWHRRRGGYFAFSAAVFLHSERNFLRSLPLSPLASASFEHSSEAAVRGFSAFFSAGVFASVLVASVVPG